ncbi:GIY-YIG nuclease family protein [Nostoc sp.]
MLNPTSIDLTSLPSVPLSKYSQLPEISGIYFAIDSLNTVQYIGRAKNILSRWRGHHRKRELQKLDGVRISYLAISDTSLLNEVESALIEYFNPCLNGDTRNNRFKRPERKVNYRLDPRVKEAVSQTGRVAGRSENLQAEYFLKVGYLHDLGLNIFGLTEKQIIQKFEDVAPNVVEQEETED